MNEFWGNYILLIAAQELKPDIAVFTKKELDGKAETRIQNLNRNKTLISYGEKFAA